ncbi:hypothetical protein [Verrucomicrobium sp. BvORR034]|uniref:hypothetical protein n=1 Tax=Verrucomicrobium sp. BvORR034 TaxID=1396418 RepID=UPI00067997D9|nr:hypothetical protein [Verrucomicrobium sp. BvORR034]
MDLWIRLAAVGTLVRVSRRALLYRRHPQGASRNTRRMLENALRVLSKNASILAEKDRASTLQKGYRWLYRDYGFHLLYKAVKSRPRMPSDALLFARAFVGPLIRDRHLVWMVMQDTVIRPAKKLLFHNRSSS